MKIFPNDRGRPAAEAPAQHRATHFLLVFLVKWVCDGSLAPESLSFNTRVEMWINRKQRSPQPVKHLGALRPVDAEVLISGGHS